MRGWSREGEEMEKCIFCHGEYNPEKSTSIKPLSLCSKECEQGFNEHQKAVRNWIYTSPITNK